MPHGLQQHFWDSVLKLKGRIMQHVSILDSPCFRRNWDLVPLRTEANWQQFLVQRAEFMVNHGPGPLFHWHKKAWLWLTVRSLLRKVPTFSLDLPYQHHSLSSPGASRPARFERRWKKNNTMIFLYRGVNLILKRISPKVQARWDGDAGNAVMQAGRCRGRGQEARDEMAERRGS